MRRCSQCSTINSDSANNCGVCGDSLLNTTSVTLEKAESIAIEEDRNIEPLIQTQIHLSKGGLFGVLSGIGLTVIGVVVSPLVSPLWAVLVIIFGGVLILSALGTLDRSPTRPLLKGGFRKGGPVRWTGSTVRIMKQETKREEAEDKKNEPGGTD